MVEVRTPRQRAATRGSAQGEPDLVRHYLSDIGSTPLLTAPEEVALSRRIEAGVYAAELLRTGELGGRSAADLAAVVADGERAKDHMVRANLRLVVSTARKYAHRGLPFLDVIQEGNIGLIRAVEKFDYAKGFKFSTYAMWWIRQAIERGLAETTRVIRLPVHVVEQVNKIAKADRQLNLKLGREPSVEEVAAEVGLSVQRVLELRSASREATSLDATVGADGETTISDLIEDTESVKASEAVEREQMNLQIREVVESLPSREALIVTLRYGLHGGNPCTLQEVAERIGLTRERVRQLEKGALAQLRTTERSQSLLEWAS
ncbi:sigma-70 family RNA polymerase sigma factor [Kutzneria viridogrisea]|uniref:RNA polymerase sigma factor n=2 Tax=Kutzneria TaxID=43356 RepID=W5WEX1_9PSEU|nr:sigma-70 family RNA polymerase sigma factor [Kutzneria albida]AHH96699.1 RNA polymerase principal sigma factor hrdC [Kutzneria albida DSM 43870]MBA8928080.1 RNA polymerase primary sigma factor/RNA polymerase nonessential primary-like sigma factor [Kutzneria viridogrisea]